MAENATVIVNNTQQDLTMTVGNLQYCVHFANLAKGAKTSVRVNYNDTYKEFLIGVDKARSKLIVTSDDCCDYKCITITETDGKLDIQREPRRHYAADLDEDFAPGLKKQSRRSVWRFWKC